MSAPRQTRQRTAVSGLMDELAEFRSAQEIHDLLAATGDVDFLIGDDGETRYRRCSTQHHHHLVCRDCGSTVEISGPAVEQWADAVAAEHGFTQVSHTIEMFGRCGSCSAAGR